MFRKKKSEALRKNWKTCSNSCRIAFNNQNRIWKKESKEKQKQKMLKMWKLGKFKTTKKSRENKRLANLGNKSHFWIDGRTPLLRRLRNTSKMVNWRNAIFKRDNWTCVLCGIRSQKGNGFTVKLNADHYPNGFAELVRKYNIIDFQQGINCEELWNINNGRTLCLECHKKTTNFGNKYKRVK